MVGPSVIGHLTHPRDEEAFRDYVAISMTRWTNTADPGGPERDAAWVAAHPGELVAEGDRACRWLSLRDEDSVPDISTAGTLAGYYYKHAMTEHPLPLSKIAWRYVTAGAWNYLCWSTGEAKTAPRTGDRD